MKIFSLILLVAFLIPISVSYSSCLKGTTEIAVRETIDQYLEWIIQAQKDPNFLNTYKGYITIYGGRILSISERCLKSLNFPVGDLEYIQTLQKKLIKHYKGEFKDENLPMRDKILLATAFLRGGIEPDYYSKYILENFEKWDYEASSEDELYFTYGNLASGVFESILYNGIEEPEVYRLNKILEDHQHNYQIILNLKNSAVLEDFMKEYENTVKKLDALKAALKKSKSALVNIDLRLLGEGEAVLEKIRKKEIDLEDFGKVGISSIASAVETRRVHLIKKEVLEAKIFELMPIAKDPQKNILIKEREILENIEKVNALLQTATKGFSICRRWLRYQK